jgi:hypothetical protein
MTLDHSSHGAINDQYALLQGSLDAFHSQMVISTILSEEFVGIQTITE